MVAIGVVLVVVMDCMRLCVCVVFIPTSLTSLDSHVGVLLCVVLYGVVGWGVCICV